MSIYVTVLVGVWLGIAVYSLGAGIQWAVTRKVRAERDNALADRDHWRAKALDAEWREHLEQVPGMGGRR